MDDDKTFQDALMSELGMSDEQKVTPPAPTASEDDAPKDDDIEQPPAAVAEGKDQVPPVADDKSDKGEPESPQGGEDKVETPEEKANREAEEAAKNEPPKPITADDVKQAMRDYQSENNQRVETVNTARDEIIGHLYPEGIDKNIYDSTGAVVKTAQDIVDRGLLKDNGEPYTYEEAASFMLEAGRKMTENIKELNDWAENIAETNVSLMESNKRVMDKWGETLKTIPKEDVELLAQRFIATLSFDKDKQYVTEMKITPEDFYDMALSPYVKLNQSIARAQELEQAVKTQEQITEQAERNGIPPQRGTSTTKSNTGDPMVDALIDELAKD